jgi:hypothetical protein
VSRHIALERMWDYVHLKVEITWVEHAHLVGCKSCMKLFSLCVHTELPSEVVWDADSGEIKKEIA